MFLKRVLLTLSSHLAIECFHTAIETLLINYDGGVNYSRKKNCMIDK